MNGNVGRTFIVIILIVIGFRAIVSVQAEYNRPEPIQQDQPEDGPDFFDVSYDTQANLDQCTAQLYQQMANTINGWTTVPADRTTYYSAINNSNGCTITGWQGYVSNVQQNCNGYAVTISVTPTLASDTFGQAGVVFDSDYSEIYQVQNDGTFFYRGFTDPLGLSGTMPTIATF